MKESEEEPTAPLLSETISNSVANAIRSLEGNPKILIRRVIIDVKSPEFSINIEWVEK